MRYSSRNRAMGILLMVLVLVSFVQGADPFVHSAADPFPALPSPDNSSNETASKMQVAVYVNSIDDLDMVKGTYTVDFYLFFLWTDPRIEHARFELINGKPSEGADSIQLNSENKTGPVKYEWYRVRGDFRIIPNNMDYPYQSGTLQIKIEDKERDRCEIIFVPLTEESGIDPEFVIPGWKLGDPTFSVTEPNLHGAPIYSRLTYNIPITNDMLSSLLQTVVPPLLFCFIAGLSFLIHVKETDLVGLRYSLTTGMLISAVMYHFSQIALVPGLGVLKLFDKFMIAVYLFLTITVVVTTFCYLAEHQWKRSDLVNPLNLYGGVASIVLPVIAFWMLVALV